MAAQGLRVDDEPAITMCDQDGDEQAEITTHGIRLFDSDGGARLVLACESPARNP